MTGFVIICLQKDFLYVLQLKVFMPVLFTIYTKVAQIRDVRILLLQAHILLMGREIYIFFIVSEVMLRQCLSQAAFMWLIS